MPAPTGRNPRNYTGASTAASLLAHLEGRTLTTAVCWKVTPTAGSALGFTTHTRPLTGLTGHAGVTFRHADGLTPTTVQAGSGLSVPNLSIDAILAAAAITREDLLAGKWDFATYEVFQINYKDLTQGDLLLHKGKFGEVKIYGEAFAVEGLGLNHVANRDLGRLTTPTCPVKDFGDSQCGLALVSGTHYHDTTAQAGAGAPSNKFFYIPTALNPASPRTFAQGKAVFSGTSTALDGRALEISTYDAGSGKVTLKLPAPAVIPVGAAVRVTLGCSRELAACVNFGNAANHRGAPHVPGLEKVHRV